MSPFKVNVCNVKLVVDVSNGCLEFNWFCIELVASTYARIAGDNVLVELSLIPFEPAMFNKPVTASWSIFVTPESYIIPCKLLLIVKTLLFNVEKLELKDVKLLLRELTVELILS